MNIVLGDAEEFRKIKAKKGTGISEEKEEKRALGLIILRGDSVVSLTIEGIYYQIHLFLYQTSKYNSGPPPPDGDEKIMAGGPGVRTFRI